MPLKLLPSPKYHVLLPGPGSEVFVKLTGVLVQVTAVDLVNEADRLPMLTDAGTMTVSLQPPAFDAMSVTV